MGVFTLKYRDTLPILQVVLHDPADADAGPGELGPVHDLAGSTGWFLHVQMSDGTSLTRSMTKVGVDSDGTLKYEWDPTDWETDNVNGFLIVGPTLPLSPGEYEHRMEYEVIGAGGERLTFPNGSYDILRVYSDIGQGT